MSWNLQNLGSSKSEETLEYIAKILNKADVIAIQEIVTNPSGAKTMAKLHDILNRTTGVNWEYIISDPTISSPYRSERYAYLFKTHKVKLQNKAFLDKHYKDLIEREPFIATFIHKNKSFSLVNLHALPTKHQPETEIKYLRFLPELYPKLNLIFLGDFNLPQSHSVFNPLKKQGYEPALVKQKTSLRQKCIKNDCLASEYDNIFVNTHDSEIIQSSVIHFYNDFESIQLARKISDHIPIIAEINP